MKIIAAVMDVTRLKFFRHGYVARKTKRCLVYDPKHVVPKDTRDARSKQIR